MSNQDQRRPDEEAPRARWSATGPDVDDPPWAGRRRERDEEDDAAEAEARGSDDADRPDAGDDAEEPAENAPPGAGQVAGGPGAQLVTVRGPMPPRPPRRTGVFLDPDDLRQHVGDLLRAILGGYQVDAWGNFTFTHEGARVFVTVGMTPIGPQVGIFSITNIDVPFSEDLARFLLTTNHQLGFGAFSYDVENEAIWLKHSLLGTMLDAPELQSGVAAVASAAAHFDDAIRDAFGGRSFHDAPADEQQRAKPPDTPAEPYPNAGGYL